MRIAIATDAWTPQVNGVVTTLIQTRNELIAMGHEVLMLTPAGRISVPCPSYPEIRLTCFAARTIRRELDAFAPDCIHVATEGPIGLIVRRYCLRRKLPFTTAYHTQFPEYVRARAPIPISWTIGFMRWFHRPAVRTMVATRSMRSVLEERGFKNIVMWSRGVRTDEFTPHDPHRYELPGPIFVYLGRVSVEKNIEAFLRLDLAGSKIVIGDGPDRARLQSKYPDCRFLGYKFGRELARYLAGADVFVFPSRTDTFGVVMLEAMACGLPVAAFRVTGPVDVVKQGVTGILHENLARACRMALKLDGRVCRRYAESRSWRRSTEQFIARLARYEPVTEESITGPQVALR